MPGVVKMRCDLELRGLHCATPLPSSLSFLPGFPNGEQWWLYWVGVTWMWEGVSSAVSWFLSCAVVLADNRTGCSKLRVCVHHQKRCLGLFRNGSDLGMFRGWMGEVLTPSTLFQRLSVYYYYFWRMVDLQEILPEELRGERWGAEQNRQVLCWGLVCCKDSGGFMQTRVPHLERWPLSPGIGPRNLKLTWLWALHWPKACQPTWLEWRFALGLLSCTSSMAVRNMPWITAGPWGRRDMEQSHLRPWGPCRPAPRSRAAPAEYVNHHLLLCASWDGLLHSHSLRIPSFFFFLFLCAFHLCFSPLSQLLRKMWCVGLPC